MTRDMMMAHAERLRRRGGDERHLVKALGTWLDSAYGFLWNGDWSGADTAFEYVRAVYMELNDGSAD